VFGAHGVQGQSNAQPGMAGSHARLDIDRTIVVRPNLDTLLGWRYVLSPFSIQPRKEITRDGVYV
jgi:hypothetical protein